MKRYFSIFAAALVVALFAVPASAQDLEDNEVKPIPYSQVNPTLPHPAHEQARITLKAMIRRANCGSYQVWWDTDRDGNYDEEHRRDVGRNGDANAVLDIGRNFVVPNVGEDTSFNINVRVRNTCTQEDKFATFRLFIYDFQPSDDPRNWTDEQLDIMTQMAIQESLWYIHRTMGSIQRSNQELHGQDQFDEATGMSLWAFTINGHLPAYPPESVFNLPNSQNIRQDWFDDNSERWHNSPYAETAMRFANHLSANGGLRGIPGGEEENSCGYNPDGTDRTCNRLAGTANNQGGYARGSANVYRMGVNLGGMATVLPALAGTPVSYGALRGTNWENYIQEMADQLGAQQIDGGCARGGWIYGDYDGSAGCNTSDASTSQWAYIGLESAEIAGSPYGVFVNNKHKYRIADNLINNQRGDGGAGYRSSSGRGDFKLTGGSLVAARWLGIHQFNSNDGATAFARQSGFSRGALRSNYDTYVAHLANNWTNQRSVGSHWADSMWEFGDYLCGDTSGVYNQERCGSSYAMYSLQKGFRTGTPEIEIIGNRDWVREFNTYYLRAQDRHADNNNPMSNYDVHGRIYDTYCRDHSVTCSRAGGRLAQPMGNLVMTPSIFNPKPVAIGEVAPAEVSEGCAGGNAGLVTFDHTESFHPNPESRIVAYRWDVNANDGLWWEGDGDPDFETPDENDNFSETFEFTYPTRGNYTATLQVVDSIGQTKTTTVAIRVNPAQNVAPAAAHGGPYVLEQGAELELNGSGNDQNIGCGDNISIAWDLDNDGNYDDAQGATPTIAWNFFQNFPVEQPRVVRIRVTDSAGASATAETTLTIYPRDPVAVATAQPNPAACQQEITFVGTASYHPNPQRSISNYDWDVDGEAGFEGASERFTYAYGRFGDYQVTLRVTDDLGRTHSTQIDVAVNQGNRAPVARVADANYVVLEGDDLVLDGRGSSDDDVPCGDSIVEYAWDINGDGDFNDAGIDVTGANPTVAWAVIEANMDGPANRDTGLPNNTVTLRVTDSFGAIHTATTTVARYTARPTALVVQTPNPAAIGQRTGVANVTLDGRESFSPVPGNTIASYEWLFNPDNAPVDGAAVNPTSTDAVDNFQLVFDLPLQDGQIPPVQAYLRVTDNTGRQSLWVRYDVAYDIPPTPPTADADPTDPPEGQYHILIGESVTLDGSQSSDPDPEDFVSAYRWDIDADDNFTADVTQLDENGDGAEARIDVSAADLSGFGVDAAGTYPITLEVTDGFGQTGTDTSVLHVYEVDPVAAFTINPNPVACNAQINLDASACFHPHPDIEITSWEWDMNGNGRYDDAMDTMGRQTTMRFSQFTFGNDNVIGLRVTDSRNNTNEMTGTVAVTEGNRSPAANAGGYRDADGAVVGPYAIAVGESLTLNSDGTSDPDSACGDAVVALSWDLDRNGVEDSNEAAPQFTWAQLNGFGINGAGDYEIQLTATDRFGATGTATARLLVVDGPNAVATATPNRTGCSNNVTFSGGNSTVNGPDGQGFAIERYEWDFDGDGQYDDATGENVTRAAVALPDANNQIVMSAALRVVDETGRSGTTIVEVAIDSQNVPPISDAGGPYTTGPTNNGFLAVRLDGRGSRDPNAPCDEIVTYKWDTDGDGLYGSDDNPADREGEIVDNYTSGEWQINTVQTIRLIVCDRQGSCSPASEAEIAVLDEAPPQGEVLSPRATDNPCFGNAPFTVSVSVSDPAGDPVTVTIFIAGEEVASRLVDTPDNGAPVQVDLDVDPRNLVPEGRQSIDVLLEDDNGASAELTAGGRILFDRTAPEVTIGNELRDGVCYNPNQVPEPSIDIVDADPNPSIIRAVQDDGCGRTLRVTATDSCGNEGVGTREYLIAEPVSVDITGPADNSLVRSAQVSWDVVGPDTCASRIEATLNRAGAASQPYNEGAEINAPGEYSVALQIANCNGATRGQTRSFIVNGPPVAVAITNGHPNAVPGEIAYAATEGDGLQVDGSESRPPEAADSIVAYRWDWDGDGQFDAEGVRPNFPTENDGIFNGRLTVEDSLGLTGSQAFRVTIADVDPVADAGGPYVVPQGTPIEFDGRGSRAGSGSDPITRYEWDFDDGTDPGAGVRPVHTFVENGTYSVTLTVHDEDSSSSVVVRVEVRDVDPIVQGIDVPAQIYEIARMRFQVNAQPGAPGDPITRYEWDFDGDGDAEVAGPNEATIDHQFHDAGTYNGIVTVRDGDSLFDQPLLTEVREITMLELVQFIRVRVTEEMQAAVADGNVADVIPLAAIDDYFDKAEWGEENGYTGNTLLALKPIVQALSATHRNGVNFGLELWAMSRQLQRLIRDERAVLEAQGLGADDPSMARANTQIDDFNAIYLEPNFKADAFEANGGQLTSNLLTLATEAYYWLKDVSDPCYANGRFPIPQGFGDPATISQAAQPVNVHVTNSIGGLRDEMVNYRNAAGAAGNPGPGVEQMSSAVDTVGPILTDVAKSVTFPCPEGTTCVTDREALDMELETMSLVKSLTAAEVQGVWVRNWQACLTHALKFRIEISLLRVEFLCGANIPYVREARDIQRIGLDIFDEGNYPLALEYYADDERRCMMIDIYNRCIVPEPAAWVEDQDGNRVAPAVYDLPDVCEQDDDDAADGAAGGDQQGNDNNQGANNANDACGDVNEGNVAFRVCRDQVNQAQAADACAAAGFDGLATITSAQEQAAVETLLQDNNGYWIGLVQRGNGHEWLSGLQLDYTNWRVGEPDGNGDCVRMLSSQNWQWNDANCAQDIQICAQGCPDDWVDRPYGYVCERR